MYFKKFKFHDLLNCLLYILFFIFPIYLGQFKTEYLFNFALIEVTLTFLLVILNYNTIGSQLSYLNTKHRLSILVSVLTTCLLLIIYILGFIGAVDFPNLFVSLNKIDLLVLFEVLGIIICLHVNETYFFSSLFNVLPEFRFPIRVIITTLLYFGINALLNFYIIGANLDTTLIYYSLSVIPLAFIKYFNLSDYIYLLVFIILALIFGLII